MSKNFDFCFKLIDVIESCKVEFNTSGKQEKLEILKYKIRQFSIEYAKKVAKQKREQTQLLEKSISQYENNPAADNSVSFDTYEANKLEFEALMDEKTFGHIIRSKTEWYEKGEKSSKFFLSLEKKRGIQNTLKVVTKENSQNAPPVIPSETTECPIAIKNEIKNFYTNLFKRKSELSVEQCLQF